MTHQETQQAKITLLTVLSAVIYGVIHDQITAHLCVEYFSIGHPDYFHTTSPTMLGLCWGIAATAPVGMVLGTLLGIASQSGSLPPYPVPRLSRLILGLLGAAAIAAFLSGILAFELSRHSIIPFPASFADDIAPNRHAKFMAVWFAHIASYLVALGGGSVLVFRIWRLRGKPNLVPLVPRSRWEFVRLFVLLTLVGAVYYLRITRT